MFAIVAGLKTLFYELVSYYNWGEREGKRCGEGGGGGGGGPYHRILLRQILSSSREGKSKLAVTSSELMSHTFRGRNQLFDGGGLGSPACPGTVQGH